MNYPHWSEGAKPVPELGITSLGQGGALSNGERGASVHVCSVYVHVYEARHRACCPAVLEATLRVREGRPRVGRLNTEKHKHRKCQTQDPAFAFGCVAFGCVWIHSAFAAFAFGCVLRLGVLRLPAFGSGSAFAAFSTSAFGPRVHHSAFGMILRLRLATFAFGCVCVWLRLR